MYKGKGGSHKTKQPKLGLVTTIFSPSLKELPLVVEDGRRVLDEVRILPSCFPAHICLRIKEKEGDMGLNETQPESNVEKL